MTDLTSLSDADLQALYAKSAPAPASTDLSKLSDDELTKLYHSTADSTGMDVLKSVGTGLVKGAAGLAGTPISAINAINRGAAYVTTKPLEWAGIISPETGQHVRDRADGDSFGGIESLQGGAQNVLQAAGADYHEPQTTAGKVAETVSEFVPGALTGGASSVGNVVKNVAKYAVAPGVTSEGAGELTHGMKIAGHDVEPWARGAAALLTGGTAAYLSTPTTAVQQVAKAAGLSDSELMAVDGFMKHAAARGNEVSFAEAVQHVTNNRTNLADLQNVIENSTKGGPILKQFYAGRPAANERMAGEMFDTIAPPNPAPTEIGPRVQKAAQGELDATREGINAQARPHYDASVNELIAPQDMAGLMQSPGYAEALRRVKSSTIQDPALQGLPDNAVGMVDAVKKELDAMHKQRSNPMSENENLREASLINSSRKSAIDTAGNAAPDYQEALRIGAEGRQNVLNPLERSPTGKVAGVDEWRKQAETLFEANPDPNSHMQIGDAMRAIAARDPQAAEDLTRAFMERTFNEKGQRLVGGENQAGGARYAAEIAGNAQQEKNLEAAIRALPNGDARWLGVKDALDILRAQGTRKPQGSATAFNQQFQKELGEGSGVINAVQTVAAPKTWASAGKDIASGIRYGRNSRNIAELLTDPNAAERIMNETGMSRQGANLLLKTIIAGANGGAH